MFYVSFKFSIATFFVRSSPWPCLLACYYQSPDRLLDACSQWPKMRPTSALCGLRLIPTRSTLSKSQTPIFVFHEDAVHWRPTSPAGCFGIRLPRCGDVPIERLSFERCCHLEYKKRQQSCRRGTFAPKHFDVLFQHDAQQQVETISVHIFGEVSRTGVVKECHGFRE